METLFLSVAAVIFVYIVVALLLPRTVLGAYNPYTQKALERIYRETRTEEEVTDDKASEGFVQGLFTLPVFHSLGEQLLKAGLGHAATRFMLGVLGLFFLLLYIALHMHLGGIGLLAMVFFTWFIPRTYLKKRIERRNQKFINMFPDALDMIVRSVRSGFPLLTALKMIADNLEDPVAGEFKQVVDEVAYGRPLNDALGRLAMRIDEPDIQFFVVVLSVQQEAGGNLAEVMNNLSTVIRSRKQLRLKIRSLTSEGRATGWVLGSLPVAIFLLLYFISPQHLQPLFDTDIGHLVLAGSAGLVGLSVWIVTQMIKIDI